MLSKRFYRWNVKFVEHHFMFDVFHMCVHLFGLSCLSCLLRLPVIYIA